MATRIPYPPCQINRVTEKPFTKHSWEISPGESITKLIKGEPITFYRVRCSRCGINDPRPPQY